MMTKTHPTLLTALVTAAALTTGAVVYAQPRAPIWDSSQLPETKGTVKQYTLTPRGDVDGLILNDGTEVKLPAHLSTQIVYAVRPGDAVTVRGLKARALPLVDAATVTNDTTRVTVADNGPRPGMTETAIDGKITALLHGKRGEVNGALLENGTMLRLPPHEAERLQSVLQLGQPVAARGVSLATPLGTVVAVRAIGSSADKLTEVSAPPHGPGFRAGPKGGPKGKGDRDR